MSRVTIIAEAGVNHDGSLEDAKALVNAAQRAGADAVKFQAFRTLDLVRSDAPTAAYQSRGVNAHETQHELLAALELDPDALGEIARHCREQGIRFLATPFDLASLASLVELGVDRLKLGSGEVTNAPLLVAAAQTGLPLILSTGMATLGEIEEALGVLACTYADRAFGREAFRAAWREAALREAVRERVTLLHCVTEYPAPPADVNLRSMETLRRAFDLPVGLSDHTMGIGVAVAAVALGAQVIEKHFTLDRGREGPDHGASLEPHELEALVREIRAVELALGSSVKVPAASELPNIAIVRRSLVATRAIRAGEAFDASNVGAKRPATATSAMDYYDYMGRVAARDYAVDEEIP